jgi:hypothetical protein
MGKNYRWPGDWKVVCDSCGFEWPSSKMQKRWDGLMVCPKDFETRHPMDFIKGFPDDPSVPFARPEPEDNFRQVCWLWELSNYADLAVADCATADNDQFSYSFLLELRNDVAWLPQV